MKSKSIDLGKKKKDTKNDEADEVKLEKQVDIEKAPKKGLINLTPLKKRVFSTKIEKSSSPKSTLPVARFKKILIFCTFLALVLTTAVGYLIYYYVYSPLNNINESVNRIEENSTHILDDFSNKDLSKIDLYVNNISGEISLIEQEISRYEFLQDFDSTKGYYDNLVITQEILNKSEKLIDKTLPDLKNVLETSGFTVTEGQVIEESEESSTALNLVTQELALYIDLYEEIEPDIYSIFDDVKRLNPEYLPSYNDFEPEEDFPKVLEFIEEYPETSEKTKNFFEYIPVLIGANETAEYMVILQNEAEMRSSGGLLTAYGSMKIDNGEFDENINLSDTWNIENYVRSITNVGPDDFYQLTSYPPYVSPWGGYYQNIYGQLYLMNSGCGATSLRAQDAGLYPDLTWTMNIFSDYYDVANQYNKADYPSYDHMLIINHKFAQDLIKLVEPIQLEGYGDVTSENLFEVIKFETDDTSRQFDPNRKEIIGEIANIAKEKFLDLPLTDMPLVANTVIKSFQAKDIAIGSKDATIQQYLDDYGLSGKVAREFDGDYFHLNEAQNCSLKLNRWVRDTVLNEVHISNDGSIRKSIVVHWTQPKIFEDSISKQYWPTLQYRYRAWVRVFMPEGSYITSSDGYNRSHPFTYYPQEYYDGTMNKYVSDNIIAFDHRRFTESDPIDKQDLIVSYNLPDNLNYNANKEYKVLIQKHPGKSWEDGTYENYTFNIYHNDQMYAINFDLDRDKVLTYKDGVISVDNYDESLDWISGLLDRLPFDKLGNLDE